MGPAVLMLRGLVLALPVIATTILAGRNITGSSLVVALSATVVTARAAAITSAVLVVPIAHVILLLALVKGAHVVTATIAERSLLQVLGVAWPRLRQAAAVIVALCLQRLLRPRTQLAHGYVVRKLPLFEASIADVLLVDGDEVLILNVLVDVLESDDLGLADLEVCLADIREKGFVRGEDIDINKAEQIDRGVAGFELVESFVDLEKLADHGRLSLQEPLGNDVSLGICRTAGVRLADGDLAKVPIQDIHQRGRHRSEHVKDLMESLTNARK